LTEDGAFDRSLLYNGIGFEKGISMEFLMDPNIAYVLLVVGAVTLLLAILTPGTGLLEIGAVFLLLLAGYAIYHLGFNVWALILLIVAIAPFIYAIRKPGRAWALGLSILGVVIGSAYLFPSEGWIPAVNPILAIIASLLVAGFLWLVTRKAVAILHTRPIQDLKSLVGQIGQARGEVHTEGTIQVDSELWSARSEMSIPNGAYARVVGREGFTLIVERDDQSKK
jgi:membrane-bound serine protease (ClpP class)